MKIILFSNSSRSFLNFRLQLLLELKKKYSNIIVICPKDKDSILLKNQNIFIENVKMHPHSKNLLKEIILLIKVFFIYKKHKPDIACHFTIKANLYGSLICKILKIKNINNITGLGETFIKKGFFLKIIVFLYKISFNKTNHIFFQNRSDQKLFNKIGILNNLNYSLLPGSGINLQKYKTDFYPNSKNIVFLFIGRIIKEKGIQELLEAAKIIKSKYENISFNFIGERNTNISFEFNKIFDEAIEKNIIQFFDYQSNVSNFIINSNAIILPSYREGLSHSLLTSASLSRPLIVSNVPGCKELVKNNFNGYLFDPKDYVSLTKAIVDFLNLTNDQMKQMGLRSREIVLENYDENIVIDQYKKVIDKI